MLQKHNRHVARLMTRRLLQPMLLGPHMTYIRGLGHEFAVQRRFGLSGTRPCTTGVSPDDEGA
jgi:hypothetical protein